MLSRGIRKHPFKGSNKNTPLLQVFKQIRDNEDFTNKQLAEILQLPYFTVKKLCNGHTDIRDKHIDRLLKATGYSITLEKNQNNIDLSSRA